MKYRTIVADPPWPYRWTGDSTTPRAIQYPTMGLLEIAELPIAKLAENEAHLYLWITPEFNRRGEGSRIVQWWGFEYVGEIVWAKPSIGMGRFPRTSHEYLLVGRRGKLPFNSRDTHSVQRWPQPSRHSEKPDASFDLIQQVSPGPYLELFARKNRLGWDTWGNESFEHVSMEAVSGL